MNITLKNIDDLRMRANVSYKEAKEALEQSDGNMIDSLILLESENKTLYDRVKKQKDVAIEKQRESEKREHYKSQADDFFLSLKNCINNLNKTRVIMYNSKRVILDISSLIVIIATIFVFPIVLCIFVVGLVTGNRYKIVRNNKKTDMLNRVLDKVSKVSQAAANVLKENLEKKEVDLNK